MDLFDRHMLSVLKDGKPRVRGALAGSRFLPQHVEAPLSQLGASKTHLEG